MAEKIKAGEGPTPDLVRTYGNKVARLKSKVDEQRGELGALYQQLEEDGIARGPFKLAMKLRGMDPTKSAEYLRNLELYCEIFGLTAQPDLFDEGAEQAEQKAAAEGEPVDYSNTQAYDQGIAAGAAGKAATINPYADGSPGNGAWNSGWLSAQRKIAGSLNGHGHAAAGAEKKPRARKASAATVARGAKQGKSRKAKQVDA